MGECASETGTTNGTIQVETLSANNLKNIEIYRRGPHSIIGATENRRDRLKGNISAFSVVCPIFIKAATLSAKLARTGISGKASDETGNEK
jgi:hypothetical protein